jgi:hypothetical protein
MGDHRTHELLEGILGILVRNLSVQEKIMADTTKLTASVAKLTTDVGAFLASQANDQPAVDAAQLAVDAVDAKIVAATPAPVPPTA